MTGRRFVFFTLGTAVILFSGWAVAWASGLRINMSASVPVGIWRESPLGRAINRGEVVAVCPEDTEVFRTARSRGYFSAGWCGAAHDEVMFKPVAAIAGDVVTVSAAGIAINGVSINHTAALHADTNGEPLRAVETGIYSVAQGTVWLISDYNDRSFDSRYFGAISVAQVRGIMRPLLLFGSAT